MSTAAIGISSVTTSSPPIHGAESTGHSQNARHVSVHRLHRMRGSSRIFRTVWGWFRNSILVGLGRGYKLLVFQRRRISAKLGKARFWVVIFLMSPNQYNC